MSKGGGAGKVYFVLYLAVVLELLIIIVERDEAEEHLHKKTQEAMRIVESILSQLQSGSGTEGINTRPQDEITIPPAGLDIEAAIGADLKPNREYTIEVGVTDISGSVKKREFETDKEYVQRLRKLVELANVEEIEYQIFFNPDENPDNAPPFPDFDWFNINQIDLEKDYQPGEMLTWDKYPDVQWEFIGMRKLQLDKDQTFNEINLNDVTAESIKPVYPPKDIIVIGPDLSPSDISSDSVFYYSDEKTGNDSDISSELQKRAFVVNFEPPAKAGWYKLRFASKTNKILGVKAETKVEEVSDETTVNIGTVQLSVGDLKKVKKELTSTLEKYNLPTMEQLVDHQDYLRFNNELKEAKDRAATEAEAEEILSKIDLYGYIIKLLVPGMSINFEQNKGSLEYNIRVMTPEPPIADPVISLPDYVATFDELPGVFEFTISPYQSGQNTVEGRVIDATGNTAARLNLTPLDQMAGLGISAPVNGEKRQYRAVVDQTLPPGKYKIEVTHKLMSKVRTDDISGGYEVFESGLTEDSRKNVDARLQTLALYSYPLILNAEPTSGGKIKANQFKIYLKTDADNQIPPFEGLAIKAEDNFVFTPTFKEISLRIAWEQPYTGQEVDLFPEKTYEVKQQEPNITDMRKSVDVSGTAQKFNVLVTNIQVIPPPTGAEQDARVTVKLAGEPKQSELAGYAVSVEPTISGDPDGGYTIEFEMQGKLAPGQKSVSGRIDIPLIATAVNPVNGVVSSPFTANISIPIKFEPESNRGRRRR